MYAIRSYYASIERIKELCDFGRKNIAKFDFIKSENIEYHCMDGSKGFEKNAPYDRILVSAMSKEVPKELISQLAQGGKMIIPINNDICFVKKDRDNKVTTEKFPGFSFVPLIEKNDF